MGLLGNILVLLSPLYLLFLSATFIPITAYHLIKTLQFRKFTSWSAFQHAWFGKFWSWFGPRGSDACAPIVEPLLKNARGVVLDIGPGTGQWLKLFSAAKNEDITKIYGIEPNHEHHPALRAAIVRAGLEGKYEILGVGVEELDRCGIPLGSIGTIATIQVLCSVREPQKTIKSLYPYLKPGGTWLVFEHVQTKHRPGPMDYWQNAVNLIWPCFFDGRSITRPSDEWLLQAGEWERVDLKTPEGQGKFDTLPRVYGTLIKRR